MTIIKKKMLSHSVAYSCPVLCPCAFLPSTATLHQWLISLNRSPPNITPHYSLKFSFIIHLSSHKIFTQMFSFIYFQLYSLTHTVCTAPMTTPGWFKVTHFKDRKVLYWSLYVTFCCVLMALHCFWKIPPCYHSFKQSVVKFHKKEKFPLQILTFPLRPWSVKTLLLHSC